MLRNRCDCYCTSLISWRRNGKPQEMHSSPSSSYLGIQLNLGKSQWRTTKQSHEKESTVIIWLFNGKGLQQGSSKQPASTLGNWQIASKSETKAFLSGVNWENLLWKLSIDKLLCVIIFQDTLNPLLESFRPCFSDQELCPTFLLHLEMARLNVLLSMGDLLILYRSLWRAIALLYEAYSQETQLASVGCGSTAREDGGCECAS